MAESSSSDRGPEEEDRGLQRLWRRYGKHVVIACICGGLLGREVKRRWPQRQKIIHYTLVEGDSLGFLVTKFVGPYTEDNMEKVKALNKKVIVDIDYLQPGQTIRIPDNRVQESQATVEEDWWKKREKGELATKAGIGTEEHQGQEAAPQKSSKKAEQAWDVKDPWQGPDNNSSPETPSPPKTSKNNAKSNGNKIRLPQDDW